MTRYRRAAFALLTLLMIGVVGGLGGYAIYLRSPAYRSYCAQRLSNKIGLESEIGRVIPRSWYSRDFEDVLAWLPDRRALAAAVHHARLEYDTDTPAGDDYNIQLFGGRCEVSTQTWFRDDYRFVVNSGLRPGFDPDGPNKVIFNDIDIAFARGDFKASLDDASGVVRFANQTDGTASVTCRKFNGFPLDEPVVLSADFSPTDEGIRIDQLNLRVPAIPLRYVGLQSLANIEVTKGSFSGTVSYLETDIGECVTLAGQCGDLVLAELTAPFVRSPWRGECPQIELQELTVNNRVPETLRFAGRIREMHLSDLLGLIRPNEIAGELVLDVREANLSRNGIDRFVASGTCKNVDLKALSEFSNRGTIGGIAALDISDLTIVNNRIQNLELRLMATPREKDTGWISRDLILDAAQRILKFQLPPLLPERIEYFNFGVELRVIDEVLYIHGTHGELDKTILTAKGPGSLPVPLIREPNRAFPLAEWLDPLRERLHDWLDRAIEQLEQSESAAATDP